MSTWRELVPTAFPKGRVARIERATIYPRGLRDAAGRRLPTGIFRPDGSVLDPDRLELIETATAERPTPPPAPERFRSGAWLFGGLVLNHFGHVLIETGARLWAINQLRQEGIPLNGVLFFRKKSAGEQGAVRLPPTTDAFLKIFSPGIPVECVELPEVVEQLYVPEIGISGTPDRFVGIPEQWQFFRDSAERIPAKPEPLDLYVSRGAKGSRGGLLFEADIEAAMATAGYQIYHPEHHSISDQIATYRATRRLVAIDGSALHLAAAALSPSARVAVLARREFFAWAIADQLQTAARCAATVIDARQEVFNFAVPLGSEAELRTVKGWSSSFALPNFQKLGEELVRSGFLEALPAWPPRAAADLDAEIARAGRLHADELRPVSPGLLALQPYHGAHTSWRNA